MISFRYHVVTIVAVFLALAIGLLGGGAFLQPALQSKLETNTASLRRTIGALRAQIDRDGAQLDAMASFSDAALGYLTGDRLLGTRVIVITQDGVDGSVVAETQRALDDAGAETVAVLTARASLASTDQESQARLAQIIGRPAALAVDLPSLTANALAERLATSRVAGPASDDLLAQLLSAGYLTAADEGTKPGDVGGQGEVVVVLGGGTSTAPALPPSSFAMPLVGRLVELGVPVAVGESTDTPAATSLVSAVRDGPGDAVVSVDDLDASMGGAQLVLGLAHLVQDGTGGAYGFKGGAEPLPPAP